MTAKEKIVNEIQKTNDPNLKAVLLLMMAVLEEIGDKIDTVISDEQALRETVLNGHEPVHRRPSLPPQRNHWQPSLPSH